MGGCKVVLKELCALRGVSGDEGCVRAYIRAHIEEHADLVTTDKMGNLIAFKKGTKPGGKHVLLAAHMDEVGLMVLGIEDDGLLRFDAVGGVDPRVIVSKRVLVGENAVPGVIGAKAIHLQTREEFSRALKHKDLYIDIGAKDKKDAERLVSPGDYVSFVGDWVEFGRGMVKSKALDDRVGCMCLMSLLEGEYPVDITCAFTVQEEVGLRGARCVGYNVPADLALVLEGTTANDLGDIPEHLRVCTPGKGVVLSFMDRTSIANVPLWTRLRDLARAQDIPWQLKKFVSGGNDAGALQTARGAVPVAALSVPCRYIHSPSSVAALCDVEAQYRLADAFLRAMD